MFCLRGERWIQPTNQPNKTAFLKPSKQPTNQTKKTNKQPNRLACGRAGACMFVCLYARIYVCEVKFCLFAHMYVCLFVSVLARVCLIVCLCMCARMCLCMQARACLLKCLLVCAFGWFVSLFVCLFDCFVCFVFFARCIEQTKKQSK